MTHLLVTNDFPPKVGGIQTYLWELWRRLDPSSFVVLTAESAPTTTAFDAEAAAGGVRIVRVPRSSLLPTPETTRRVRGLAAECGASMVVLDPALPLGLIGPHLGLPYAVVLHGAEVTVPARLPAGRQVLGKVLAGASLAVCAGEYPAAEATRAAGGRMPPVVNVPPGVDLERFVPPTTADQAQARTIWGFPDNGPLVVSLSRLVPRKGMDVLIDAAAALVPSYPSLVVAIAGTGRDRGRLERRADSLGAPVRFLGQVPEADKPALYGAADLFVMACRNRWSGLEQEGFGIVFLEAAACGVPQVAGRSGGAYEAVSDGVTGRVVDEPGDPGQLAGVIRQLLDDDGLRRQMGESSRQRVESSFGYDFLARRLSTALGDVIS
jgi:phosphatidylinositol alpha-1,6-mannosyltransferase